MMKLDRSRRILFGAFAFSLLLHLLALLGGGPARLLPLALPRPVRVEVFLHPAAAVARVDPLPAAALPQKTAAAPLLRKVRPRIEPLPAVSLRPVSPVAADVPLVAGTPLNEPAPSPLPSMPARPVARDDHAFDAHAINADSLRQYRIDVAVAARRFRLYPALARTRGWVGVVEVGLSVSPVRPVPTLRLARSSGHAVLDEQAMRMLTQAVAEASLPEDLQGHSFELVVPIRFSLED